jgi:hypothetical protein
MTYYIWADPAKIEGFYRDHSLVGLLTNFDFPLTPEDAWAAFTGGKEMNKDQFKLYEITFDEYKPKAVAAKKSK